MNVLHATLTAGLCALPLAMPAGADSHQDLGAFVVEALNNTLMAGNASAIPDYFSPGYINHNPGVADGLEPLAGLADKLQPVGGLQGEIHRVIVDGSTVALHSTWTNVGPAPLVAFDVFRVEDGLIVEHWDNLTPATGLNPSGRSQTDGQTEVTDLDRTEENRALVIELITKAFINGENVDFARYINPET